MIDAEEIEDLADGTYYSKRCGPPIGLILLSAAAFIWLFL